MIRPNLKRHGATSQAPAEGFQSLGEFVRALILQHRDGTKNRFLKAATGVGENASGGGFLIPEFLAEQIIDSIYAESMVSSLCYQVPTAGQFSNVNLSGIDETSRADGLRWGGVTTYWLDEGATVTSSLPKWKKLAFTGRKIVAAIFATGELMADSPSFGTHIAKIVPEALAFDLDAKIINGTGAGVPLGITNSPATISVAKDSGQAAATITPNNIINAWSRLPGPCRKRAIWLAHEDVELQLDALAALGQLPIGLWTPAGLFGNTTPLLKGRPFLTVEQCPAVGTPGDLIAADLSYYMLLNSGVIPAISADVQFLSGQTVLRFVMRVDGKPALVSPITPLNGSLTKSPFVALAAR